MKYILVLPVFLMFFCQHTLAYHVREFRAPDVLIKSFEFGTNQVYLIQQNKQWLMIDSSYPKEGPDIVKALKHEGINMQDVKYLILTHSHSDHTGNALFFQQKYGLKIIAGQGDLQEHQQGKNAYICPTSWFADILLRFGNGIFPAFTPDHLIENEYNLQQIGFKGTIYPHKSHTPGSLVIKIGKYMFVGDLIRGGILFKETPMLHFVMCDLKTNHQELQNLLTFKDIAYWLPGHFGPLKIEDVREYMAD